MQIKLIQDAVQNLFRRDADPVAGNVPQTRTRSGAADLRSTNASADRDRSSHRRSTWLYDDLLN